MEDPDRALCTLFDFERKGGVHVAGRKSKLTPELQKKFCAYVSGGLTKKGAADAVCISETALYDWLQRGQKDEDAGKDTVYSEFLESVKKAEADFKLTHIRTIQEASADDWKAAAWLLERCYRNEYGRAAMDVNLGGQPGGEPVKTESAVQIYLPDNHRGDQ